MSKETSVNNNWNVNIRQSANNNDYNKRNPGKRNMPRQNDQELNGSMGNKNKYSFKVSNQI
jgi:hypothetical protein